MARSVIRRTRQRPEDMTGIHQVTGYKVIPAKNVPSKKTGINPTDIIGPFAKAKGADDRLYLTSSLEGAKLYAWNVFNSDRNRRQFNTDYKNYMTRVKDNPTEKDMSFKEFKEQHKHHGKTPGKIAIIEVSLLSKGGKPRKDLSEVLFGYGDQYWVDHKDIVPDSIDIKLVGYFSEDDLKDIEKFEMEQFRPDRERKPDVMIHGGEPDDFKQHKTDKGTKIKFLPDGPTFDVDLVKSQVITMLKDKGFHSSNELLQYGHPKAGSAKKEKPDFSNYYEVKTASSDMIRYGHKD